MQRRYMPPKNKVINTVMHAQIRLAIFSNSVPSKVMRNTIFFYCKSQYISLAKEQDVSKTLLNHQINSFIKI